MTSTLGSFDGIEINLSSLGNIEIQPDGETAWFQGGTYDGQVIDYLWDRGYVASKPIRGVSCCFIMPANSSY